MQSIRPISDLRNKFADVSREVHASDEPVIFTKNGRPDIVVMSAEAFDRMLAEQDELRSREERVYRGILQGIEEFHSGDTTPAKDGFAAIRERKGWH